MSMSMPKRARHAIADIVNLNIEKIEDQAYVEQALKEVITSHGLTLVHEPVTYKFQPYGLTSFVLFKQSHLSIHTYPEYQLAKVDAFTYAEPSPAALIEDLAKWFDGKVRDLQVIDRGDIG